MSGTEKEFDYFQDEEFESHSYGSKKRKSNSQKMADNFYSDDGFDRINKNNFKKRRKENW